MFCDRPIVFISLSVCCLKKILPLHLSVLISEITTEMNLRSGYALFYLFILTKNFCNLSVKPKLSVEQRKTEEMCYIWCFKLGFVT